MPKGPPINGRLTATLQAALKTYKARDGRKEFFSREEEPVCYKLVLGRELDLVNVQQIVGRRG